MKLTLHKLLRSHNIFMTLSVALLWFAAAQTGFYFASSQTFPTTPLWIPSGFALGILLLYGSRVIPGIFLGAIFSALFQFYNQLSGEAIVAVALIGACAVSLGSVITYYLTKRFADTVPIWGSARDMLVGTGCMAIGSSIPAFLTTTLFKTLGLVPESVRGNALETYWLGDFFGMVIFTAPVFILGHWLSRQKPEITSQGQIFSPTLLFSAFTAAALSVFIWLKMSENDAMTDSLQREANIAAHGLTRALENAGRDLESIRALVYAHDRLQRSEWLRFSKTEFGTLESYPGTQALSWAPKIVEPRMWQREMRYAGDNDARLFETGPDGRRVGVDKRDNYFPVELVYPMSDVNRKLLGFDLGSERNRRRALQRARDTGLTSMVAPIYQAQSDEDVVTMLMCLPVYRLNANPTTRLERRQHLIGYATGVYHIGSIFDSAIPDFAAGITLNLFDLSQPSSRQWYHSFPMSQGSEWKEAPIASELRSRFYGESFLRFAGQTWLIIATPDAGFAERFRTQEPWAALLLIIALGLGISSILIERIAARRRFEEERVRTIAALEEANAANESKSYFMAAASHDIKQPLYALGILTETLLMSDLKEGMRPIIENVGKSVKEMSLHFDTLMDMGRFQDGSFEVDLGEVTTDELARRIDLELSPLCKEKGLRWHLDLGSYAVISDPELLLRLLRNLLINAVSYTEHGDVSCRVSPSTETIEICVSDTGPGLSRQQRFLIEQAKIVPRQDVINSSEMQLGFSIVNRISRALGLVIEVQTSQTAGTQFRFKLERVQRSERQP